MLKFCCAADLDYLLDINGVYPLLICILFYFYVFLNKEKIEIKKETLQTLILYNKHG
ncbi:hypothetical protein BJ944DRAFT_263071 [Cunninghamella echinulata]|nr:hypothetical protein BJ944DRAFT_263071 [Cunninghamella echinulata]